MREVACRSASPDQTRGVAAVLSTLLGPGDVVVLAGDLGAGKTVFVQGAAEALGVSERVTSPSFVLVREYEGSVPILHADVYRLNSLQELIDLGYEDVLDPAHVLFVEWGDAVGGVLPADRLEVEIRREADDARRLSIRGMGTWTQRMARVEELLRGWAAA